MKVFYETWAKDGADGGMKEKEINPASLLMPLQPV